MRICVFCGSQSGRDGCYRRAAAHFGRLLGEQGHALVFGGGSVGLMGVLADAALDANAPVTGVIPLRLATRELLHPRVQDMRRVNTMHERKALMAELADAFVALPGGFGTLEEFFEVVTWAQLGIHAKPIGLLNVAGYFHPLAALIEHAVEEGFIPAEQSRLVVVEDQPEALLQALLRHRMPAQRPWLSSEET